MKKLSIEEKAKAYDEAKARMSIAYNSNRCTIGFMNEIFPELKESEDEKIRKELIDFLEYYRLNNVLDSKTISLLTDSVAWLEKQAEQKPAWSKEDESLCRQIEGILSVCRTKSLLSFDLYKKMLDLLNSLKDRVQPQPKQEWSEEEEKMIGNIRRIIEQYAFSKSAVDVNGELCEKEFIDADNWLKSLKDRYAWKPSDEQMDALESAVSSLQSTALESLYNKLKKL